MCTGEGVTKVMPARSFKTMKTANWKTLAVSVVCLMLLSTAMVQIAFATSDKGTKILLSEDFENKRKLENVWSFVAGVGEENGIGGVAPGGSWTVVDEGSGNHVLQAQSEGGIRGTAAFAGDTRWKDYTIEARTITTDSYMGLIVQADPYGKTYYSCYVSPNWPGGLIEIFKHTNGIWGRTWLAEKYTDDYITQADWIDLKVRVSNPNGGTLLDVFFKLDGPNQQYPETPQLQYFDINSPYTSGSVGLIFYDNGAYGSTYELFDNVVVTASK